MYPYFCKFLHVCSVLQFITSFQPYIFAILKSISFIMYCFFTFYDMASIFQRTYQFCQSVGTVSPSKGHPTFKAMRFSMVGVKILSTPFQVADSNNNGGFVLFLLYKEGTFARSIRDVNSGSKAMCLLTSVQEHPRRENNNFFLSSLPSVLCQH